MKEKTGVCIFFLIGSITAALSLLTKKIKIIINKAAAAYPKSFCQIPDQHQENVL